MQRLPTAGLLIGGVIAIAAGCSGSRATTLPTPATTTTTTTTTTTSLTIVTTSPAATAPPTITTSSTAVVPVLLDFEAPLVGGGTIRGADLAGRDTLFWFWAPL
ncbi:MAG: hypothetical protein VX833_03710 [Actinomycetota bacterium]|nr:hypothetical protein [Actinomycetota bacterium]